MLTDSDKIPFVSLATEETRATLPGLLEGIRELFEKSQFILGDEVARFEREIARLTGCSEAVGVNSGLDALILSLKALKLSPGDEVITPPNSFLGSTSCIALAGAKPVFADVGPDYNLDPDAIERAITSKTKVILVVHLTGNPCAMSAINELAREHRLAVVEDAAQAIGATYGGKPVGGLGDFGCFSLHPLKNLHVWGDGGVITVNDPTVASHLRLARNHGLRNRDESDFFSFNSRLDTIQAIVGLHSLPLLERVTAARRRNAALYAEGLTRVREWITPPLWDVAKANPVFHVYQVRAKRRDALRDYLSERGIETKIHYPIPIHFQKAAEFLGYKRGDFPMTERLADEIVSFPVRENLTEAQIYRICDSIERFYKK